LAALIAVALAASCSAPSDDRIESKGAAVDGLGGNGSSSGSASVAVEPAASPIEVAGAFLVQCSADTKTSYAKDIKDGEELTACAVHDSKGTTVKSADELSVTITRKDGSSEPATLAAKGTDAPWLVGFKLAPEDAADVAAIAVGFKVTGHALSGEAKDTAFDWAKDATFLAYIQSTLIAADPSAGTATYGKDAPAQASNEITRGLDPALYVFATHTVYDGAVTLAEADKHCAEAGAAFSDKSTAWQALLAGEGVSAKERLTPGLPAAKVYNARKNLVANSIDDLLSGVLVAPVNYDDRGALLTDALNAPTMANPAPLDYNESVWSGAGSDTCGSWASNAGKTYGALADLGSAKSDWLTGGGKRSCLRKARLLCIGLLSPL
jgi:hypothetical protein